MPLVHLKTKRVEYKFEIRDKYTIIKGDSGSGKTTLYELVSELPVQTGVSLSPIPIIAVPRDLSAFNVNAHANVVYVINEDNPIFKLRNAA